MDQHISYGESVTRAWVEIAQGCRMTNHMLQATPDPADGSNFTQINEIYPQEKSSDWHRSYLGAALEHLVVWADIFAPLKFHPEHSVKFSFRPTHTLGRAAMEAASQALWVSSGKTARECARRHLSLIRWDFSELRKSDSDPEFKESISERDQLLLERVSGTFTVDELRIPKLLDVLRAAAPVAELDADKVENVWRAASGAAHGKNWPALHLQRVVPVDEYEPGQFRTLQFPDPEAMTEVMEIASQLTNHGVIRHADFCGSDIGSLMDGARIRLANEITFRPDADPETVAHLKRPANETPTA